MPRVWDEEASGVCVQVQRGFRSVLVYLTALDSSCDFLAVGSSTGMLYLYCRRLAHMNKYSLEVGALVSWITLLLFTQFHPDLKHQINGTEEKKSGSMVFSHCYYICQLVRCSSLNQPLIWTNDQETSEVK